MRVSLMPARKFTAFLLPLIVFLALGMTALAQEKMPVSETSRESIPVQEQSGKEGTPAVDQPRNRELRDLGIEELMDIEIQTVVSASRYRQKVSEAPSSVSIITSRDIRKFGYRTLADILRSVRGFYATYDRNYQYLGVRGFGRPGDLNTSILLLVDGHRINDAVYASAAIGTEFILDVDLIERVEVSRGPGSSLYGSNAFFAVVNIVTRSAKELDGGELSATAGSHDAYQGRLSYGLSRQKEGAFLLSASGSANSGDRLYFREYDPANPLADPRAVNGGYADKGDYDRLGSGFAKFEYKGLQLAAAYNDRIKGIPTASFGANFNDPGNRTTDRRGYVDLQYGTRIGSGTELAFHAYYDDYRYEGDYHYAGILNDDRAVAQWHGGDIRMTARLLNIHHVIMGAEYEASRKQDQSNADVFPATVYLDDHRSSDSWAGYVQDEITISPAFLIYAGVRHGRTSFFGETTNPRLAAVIKPSQDGSLKLLYGTAFRAPTVYELYYQAPPHMLSNPSLQPERIETYELVYEHDLGSGLRASVSRYSYTIRNLITQVYDSASGATSYRNQERAEAMGTELEVQKGWENGADGRISYTYQKAVDPNTGDLLPNAPKHLAKLNFAVPLIGDRIFAGIEEQITGPRLTISGRKTESYALTNVTLLTRGPDRTVEASLSIYNVLNRKYDDPVSGDLFPLDKVQQDGRTVRVKLTYAF